MKRSYTGSSKHTLEGIKVDSPNLATAKQVRLFKALFAKAGVNLAPSRLRRFKNLTVGNADKMIKRTLAEFDAYNLSTYDAPTGMATGPQLAYFVKLSKRLGYALTADEIEKLKTLTTSEMQEVNGDVMKSLQLKNDRNGVPLPAWRLERGLYDSQVLREGQRAAAARQAEHRAEVGARILDRQQAHPRKKGKFATSGGKY
jgi:hypothetical protein